jgi:hypothetical protein
LPAPAFDGHALMAQRERYAAPLAKGIVRARTNLRRSPDGACMPQRRYGSSSKILTKMTQCSRKLPDDLYDYLRPTIRRRGRPARRKRSEWTVTDDWPDEVPITEAEIDVFEVWFGDLFDGLFSTRH